MKVVAVFHDNDIYSGATRSFLSIIEYFIESGIEIIAIVPHKSGDLTYYLKKNGIEVVQGVYGGATFQKGVGLQTFTNYFISIMKMIISALWCVKIYFKLRKENIDWIYTNTSTLYVGAWLSIILGAKHIWHFREFGLLDQNFNRIFPSMFIYLAKKSSYVIVISNALKAFYKEKYHINKNVLMLYNDISKMDEIEHKSHKGLNILITGTISEGKGQKIAIDAMKKIDDDEIRLYIAGKINRYARQLMSYVNKENINNIEFCGFVKDMHLLRRNIDISVVCSASEAFGRTIIEDMLSGILVIGNNAGAVPELLENNHGVIFQYNDADKLAKEIINIKDNWSSMGRMIDGARSYANKFTSKCTAKKICKLILSEAEV
ncbi:MAG: glycosyltransferase family 4 protein [Selenomonas sp.]|jgi:glycosyltransferase involved in cell wall biosynthesis|nr:glycosyltransferase family 4 protein [Selenomonas sp.]